MTPHSLRCGVGMGGHAADKRRLFSGPRFPHICEMGTLSWRRPRSSEMRRGREGLLIRVDGVRVVVEPCRSAHNATPTPNPAPALSALPSPLALPLSLCLSFCPCWLLAIPLRQKNLPTSLMRAGQAPRPRPQAGSACGTQQGLWDNTDSDPHPGAGVDHARTASWHCPGPARPTHPARPSWRQAVGGPALGKLGGPLDTGRETGPCSHGDYRTVGEVSARKIRLR